MFLTAVLSHNVLGGLFTFGGLGSTFWGAMHIATYVLVSLSLYTIASRRAISKAWLAWVPVARVWILGSISDQYRDVVSGEVKNKRKVLLILNLLLTAGMVIYGGLTVGSLADVVRSASHGADPVTVMALMLGHMLSGMLMLLPLLGIWVAKLIISFMALFDLYTSCDPANNVLYLILTVIPGLTRVTRPLFLFLVRNRDDGMPSRRGRRV